MVQYFLPLPPAKLDRGSKYQLGSDVVSKARDLDIVINQPFDYFVAAADDGPARATLAEGLSILVMGPRLSDLQFLHEEWKHEGRAEGPSLVDQIGGFVEGYSSADIQLLRSPALLVPEVTKQRAVNAASLLLLIEAGDHRILLCGGSDSERILRGLMSAGLLADGYLTVDVFLVPGFGSKRAASLELFRSVRARTPEEISINAEDDQGRAKAGEFQKLVDEIAGSSATKNFDGFVWPAEGDTMITIRLS